MHRVIDESARVNARTHKKEIKSYPKTPINVGDLLRREKVHLGNIQGAEDGSLQKGMQAGAAKCPTKYAESSLSLDSKRERSRPEGLAGGKAPHLKPGMEPLTSENVANLEHVEPCDRFPPRERKKTGRG